MATISSGSVTVTIQPGEQYRVIATGEAYVDIGGGSTQSYRLINGSSERLLGGFIIATPVTIRVVSGSVEYINVSGTGDSVALSLAQSSRTDINGLVASTASGDLVPPSGSTLRFIGISSFSSLPPAAQNPFARYYVTDLGMAEFYSNGVSWVPSAPLVLDKNGSQSGATSGGNETVLASYQFRPNQVDENGLVTLNAMVFMTNNANTKTLRLRLGGSGIDGSILWSNTLSSVTKSSFICGFQNRNSKAAQVQAMADTTNGLGNATTSLLTATVDMTSSQTIYLTGQCAVGTDSVLLQRFILEQR